MLNRWLNAVYFYFVPYQFRIVRAKHFNWTKPLPKEITWEWASKTIPLTPFVITKPPKVCPKCDRKLKQGHHDWHDIEDGGQYMVHTYKCPKGHGAWVDWA